MAPKPARNSGGEISASVEESNEMRKKLGIKPLDVEGKPAKAGSSNAPLQASSRGPAEPTAEESKKKASAAKARREHEELVAGEGLGDILAREEPGKGGAAEWVAKTRQKDGSMKAAVAKEAKEAGAGGKKRRAEAPEAAAEVPRMKVRHDAEEIPEGHTVTMTLSDKPILDEKGNIDSKPDELSNVRMVDNEKASHNQALKSQVEYDPSKDSQNILEKYDELKTGPAGFMLGGAALGGINENDPEKRLAILTALSEKQSLESKPRLQSDFYTSEEMDAAKFRKPPPKQRKQKRRQKPADKDKDDKVGDPNAVPAPRPVPDAGSDEEDPELYEQLSKQRRLVRRSDAGAMRKGEAALAAVAERIQSVDAEADDGKEEKEKTTTGAAKKDGASAGGENIAMTATTEFCNVVQTPLEKMDTMKHESFRGSTLYKQQAAQRKGIAAGERKGRRTAAAQDEEAQLTGRTMEEEAEGLIEESLDLTCASGLAYLRARAQIGCDQESHRHRKTDNRPLEMSTVDGDIKLEYRDDFGRVQTPKEAFRAISWKFHGKTPGRKNMERRLLRLENEMRLKSMDPITALPTLRALRYVQSSDAKPYMVLSGANEK